MFLGRNINYPVHLILPRDPLAVHPINRPSKKHLSVSSLCSEITPPTRPLSVIGWNTIYFGLVWLVVPFVFVCDLRAQAAHRDTFFLRPAYGAGRKLIVREYQMNVIIYVSA